MNSSFAAGYLLLQMQQMLAEGSMVGPALLQDDEWLSL